MTDSPLLPGAHAWRDGSGKPMPVEFYKFLRDLVAYLRASGANTDSIAALEARIAALEAGAGLDATLQGLESVRVAGSLSGGLVRFRLDGDEPAPGLTFYYGTDTTGAKGWFAVSDTVEAASGELTKTVDGDGVTTFGLADVTPTAGGTLQLTTFDAKGRRTHEGAADTDDLAEGATNLYFTDTRAQAALATDLANKADVNAPSFTGLQDAVDDTAAAGLGVSVGGVYRNGSVLMIRVT